MVVRLTYLSFLPGKAEEVKRIYTKEMVSVVRRQPGNLECKLLEPVDKADDYISLTAWESQEKADAYHSSGVYTQLVNKIKEFYSKNPVLKVFTTERILEPA